MSEFGFVHWSTFKKTATTKREALKGTYLTEGEAAK